jgi:hypothetical protein
MLKFFSVKSIEKGRSKPKRQSRNYYFNSMLGPQIRRKRNSSEVSEDMLPRNWKLFDNIFVFKGE